MPGCHKSEWAVKGALYAPHPHCVEVCIIIFNTNTVRDRLSRRCSWLWARTDRDTFIFIWMGHFGEDRRARVSLFGGLGMDLHLLPPVIDGPSVLRWPHKESLSACVSVCVQRPCVGVFEFFRYLPPLRGLSPTSCSQGLAAVCHMRDGSSLSNLWNELFHFKPISISHFRLIAFV